MDALYFDLNDKSGNKSNRLIAFLVGMLMLMIATLLLLPKPYNFITSIAICGPISVCVMGLHYRRKHLERQ